MTSSFQKAEHTGYTTDFALNVREGVYRLAQNIKSVIYIQHHKLEYIVASLIVGGHVILADAHGVGKTSLARALAGSIDWHKQDMMVDDIEVEPFQRIQCTVDMLPQDILGYNRFVGSSNRLIFNKGPIFAHFILCDEINLLTPKAQGSFLQAMQEQAVTIEGRTFHLPDPFFIIATMNLKGAHLFPLPPPQLDRFMIQISLGYPDPGDEAEIIKKHGRNDGWYGFGPVITSSELLRWQGFVDHVDIHREVIDYMVECIRQTRSQTDVDMGASPRTGVKLSRLARALSLIRGQDFVSIDTVKEIFLPVVSHRVIMKDPSQNPGALIQQILESTPVDIERKSRKSKLK
ncbi:MAG: AAA family ATPase [Spirochaetota bacterium]